MTAPAEAAPQLEFGPPWPDDAARGVVTYFSYTDTSGATVSGSLSRGGAGLTISHLAVDPGPGQPGGVTSVLLRRIPVGELLRRARTQLPDYATTSPPPPEPPERRPRRGGRTRLPDSLLRDVAVAYLEETAPGKPLYALRRLAERFGRPEETVRAWVGRARKAGWLGPGTKGRVGAEPGPRLRAESGQYRASTS